MWLANRQERNLLDYMAILLKIFIQFCRYYHKIQKEVKSKHNSFFTSVVRLHVSILYRDIFYVRMTVHRNRFLVNKTNSCTEFQFYWYDDSTCFGQPSCPSSGVLSLHRLWYILCSCDKPFATRSRMTQNAILILAA